MSGVVGLEKAYLGDNTALATSRRSRLAVATADGSIGLAVAA